MTSMPDRSQDEPCAPASPIRPCERCTELEATIDRLQEIVLANAMQVERGLACFRGPAPIAEARAEYARRKAMPDLFDAEVPA